MTLQTRIKRQRAKVESLERLYSSLVLNIQKTSLDSIVRSERAILSAMTGSPEDGTVQYPPPPTADERVAEMERAFNSRPVKHIGHIGVGHVPEGTSIGSWNVYVDDKPLERVVEAHQDVGYYIQYIVDDEGKPVWDGEQIKTKTTFGNFKLVYSGSNKRYSAFMKT